MVKEIFFFSDDLQERLVEDQIDEQNLEDFKQWLILKGFKNEIKTSHLSKYLDEVFS